MSLCPKCQKPMQVKKVNGRTVYICHLHGETACILQDIANTANDEFSRYSKLIKK